MGCNQSNEESEEERYDSHKDNSQLEHEGWTSIKDKKRRCCTDFIFLVAIIACWVAMTGVGLVVTGLIEDKNLDAGDPRRLLYPIDYEGHICGYHDGVGSKPNGYYMLDGSVVCVSACPTEANYYAFVCRYDLQSDADASLYDAYSYVPALQCMYEIKTRTFINRCLPDMSTSLGLSDASTAAASVNVSLPSWAEYATSSDGNTTWFNDFLTDLYSLRGYIFGFGIGVSLGMAFIYLMLLRIPFLLFTIIWGGILTLFVVMIAATALLWRLGDRWDKDDVHSNTEVRAVRAFTFILLACCILYFCFIVVMRKRIQLAIGVVKEAAKAMESMHAVVFLPVLQAVGLVCFLVFWVIYCVYLASSGDIEIHSAEYTYQGTTSQYNYRTFNYKPNTRYAFLYLLFTFFWTSEFIVAVGQLVVALAFAAWYFTRDKSTINSGTVWWALRTTILHHLGTAAFGSLIVAIIRTIRAVVMYFQKKMKKLHNKLAEYILGCIQCCLTCLEKCIKFINKHAYIICAIYSYPFCKATRKAFFLLLRNILRVAAVNMISTFVLLLGKVFIAATTTFLCYLAIIYSVDNDKIEGIVAPLFLVFILAFWIATMFLEIFAMGIETILYCFIADEEMFGVHDRFAEAELVGTLHHANEMHKSLKLKKGDLPPPDDEDVNANDMRKAELTKPADIIVADGEGNQV
mmetsp:Transcript_3147/g.4913  ORF Transcript_3147/g.4913 Transcript_3147/m.4913 type:complete len:688 (+) Transcript_3147:32-2095(+)